MTWVKPFAYGIFSRSLAATGRHLGPETLYPAHGRALCVNATATM